MTDPANPAIYPALSAVMADVQKISKDRKVTEGPAKFSFRGVDDVVNVVGPALRSHNVIVVAHEVLSVEHERYLTKSGTPMDGVTIVIRWRFYAADGTFIEASSAGQSADSGDKAVPKAHSVAYRTVLLQALCIPTDEPDPDSQVHERDVAPPDPRIALFSEVKAVGYALKLTDPEIADDFKTWSTGTAIGAATPEQLTQYIAHLREQAKQNGAS